MQPNIQYPFTKAKSWESRQRSWPVDLHRILRMYLTYVYSYIQFFQIQWNLLLKLDDEIDEEPELKDDDDESIDLSKDKFIKQTKDKEKKKATATKAEKGKKK